MGQVPWSRTTRGRVAIVPVTAAYEDLECSDDPADPSSIRKKVVGLGSGDVEAEDDIKMQDPLRPSSIQSSYSSSQQH